MARYPIILFDLDHTLFDFNHSKHLAFAEVMTNAGYDADRQAELITIFGEVEKPLWAGLEAGELTLDTLNLSRWAGLVERAELAEDRTALAAGYLDGLGRLGRLFPGARELLDVLVPDFRIALITNGYAEVQRARMINFDLGRYFDPIVISSEVGHAKPNVEYFDATFEMLGHPPKSDCVVIGDSLTSDIAGAQRYGLDCIWYNPSGQPAPAVAPTHTVQTLEEIAPLLSA